ncbi:hypothetical protein [Clostridium perfringens]|uniref:hypothetical protein n=1 Tax=Clostridium perfringens TaxID=1502 RepID=UPI000F522B49|nr:hypothetical protein [Clostridium perfringens]BDC03423.1 hypothetical protein CP118TE_31320 [Clostridium perfringens E]
MRKDMSLIMKEAHKLTKEIKNEFPNVDYKFQLGICMSYLLNKKEDERTIELSKELDITMEEAVQLVAVEKHYQAEYERDSKIEFSIWEGYGKRRAYIKLPWRSRSANANRNNYDFGTHYLQDRYVAKQF